MPQIAALQVLGVNAAFRYFPLADPHDAAHYEVWLLQGGLGLPDRDYYLEHGSVGRFAAPAYVAHITKMFASLGGAGQRRREDADA